MVMPSQFDQLNKEIISCRKCSRLVSWREELARYLVHGTLHLLGYDDRATADRDKMSARQEKIVEKIFL